MSVSDIVQNWVRMATPWTGGHESGVPTTRLRSPVELYQIILWGSREDAGKMTRKFRSR